MNWWTIWIPDILDHKHTFSVWFSHHHFNNLTMWQPDTNFPFEFQTCPVFKWLLYSDGFMKIVFRWVILTLFQILAKRGPDSRFVLEANLKSLCPRSSRSSIFKTQNRVQAKHEYKASSNSLEYYRSYTNTIHIMTIFPKLRVYSCCI